MEEVWGVCANDEVGESVEWSACLRMSTFYLTCRPQPLLYRFNKRNRHYIFPTTLLTIHSLPTTTLQGHRKTSTQHLTQLDILNRTKKPAQGVVQPTESGLEEGSQGHRTEAIETAAEDGKGG